VGRASSPQPPTRRLLKVPEEEIKDEPPPVLGTWPRVYALILCELALVILAFYLFTVHFAP
jgi:hypothetical protein